MEFAEPDDFGDTSPLSDEDEAVLAGIAERLQAHDKIERFGVRLIRNPLGLSSARAAPRDLRQRSPDTALHRQRARRELPHRTIETTWRWRVVQGDGERTVMQECRLGVSRVAEGHDIRHSNFLETISVTTDHRLQLCGGGTEPSSATWSEVRYPAHAATIHNRSRHQLSVTVGSLGKISARRRPGVFLGRCRRFLFPVDHLGAASWNFNSCRCAIAQGLEHSANNNRNVINMLRHDYTKYEEGCRTLPRTAMCAEILDEIAEDFHGSLTSARKTREHASAACLPGRRPGAGPTKMLLTPARRASSEEAVSRGT